MGRTEPSYGRPPAGFRRDARAKRAKATANKVIPALLSTHPRARRGVESAELIVDPPPLLRGSRRDSGAPVGSSDDESERKTKKMKKKKKASPPPPLTRSGEGGGAGCGRPRISMRVADTLTAARSLLTRTTTKGKAEDLGNREARVGILNMASPLAPGGGVLNGSAAQQEEVSLCMRTTLLPSLRDGFYRLPELGAVYTPDVLVFRDSAADEDGGGGDGDFPLLGKADRWFVDCVSAAMLRMPETEELEVEVAPGPEPEAGDGDGDDVDVDAGVGVGVGRRRVYADAADRELVRRKMRVVMRVFQAKGVRRVVLGAWGVGAYGNPVEEIADAWKKVLLGSGREGNGNGRGRKNAKKEETWDGIEEVVFAIRSAGIAERFARAFGDGLAREEQESHDEAAEESQEDGDDPEEARLRELRDKVRQMELQMQQARSPQMKSGLSAVIASLRSQLPEGGKSSDQHGSSSPTHGDEEDEEEGEEEGEEEAEEEGEEEAEEDGEDEGIDDGPSDDDTGKQDKL
ncbi:hypothetical protein DL765_010786 [Monosporascus sp. GIB2]|nr:hypothetical protein DL765_010786 [Monosporascus sp. GIB2]